MLLSTRAGSHYKSSRKFHCLRNHNANHVNTDQRAPSWPADPVFTPLPSVGTRGTTCTTQKCASHGFGWVCFPPQIPPIGNTASSSESRLGVFLTHLRRPGPGEPRTTPSGLTCLPLPTAVPRKGSSLGRSCFAEGLPTPPVPPCDSGDRAAHSSETAKDKKTAAFGSPSGNTKTNDVPRCPPPLNLRVPGRLPGPSLVGSSFSAGSPGTGRVLPVGKHGVRWRGTHSAPHPEGPPGSLQAEVARCRAGAGESRIARLVPHPIQLAHPQALR